MSKRLQILKSSLTKKTEKFNAALEVHMNTVKQANGQPLNDKRNGGSTLAKWERQNESLRKMNLEIEKTKAAIEKEENTIAFQSLFEIPDPILAAIERGDLVQWRKHPRFFFVPGVDKGRICVTDDGLIAHRYVQEIKDKEQYAKFRDIFNALNAEFRSMIAKKERKV